MNNNNYNNPVQFEFFSGHGNNSQNSKNFGHAFKYLTLSFENIIVLCIIFVTSLVVSYSFGVERGKKIVKSTDSAVSENHEVVKIQTELPNAVRSGEDSQMTDGVIQITTESELPEVVESSEEENTVTVENTDKEYFTIQVASFKQEKNARMEADKLKGIGYETYILGKGSHSIVCVGKFIQRTQAVEFSGKLKNRYNDCLVRRL